MENDRSNRYTQRNPLFREFLSKGGIHALALSQSNKQDGAAQHGAPEDLLFAIFVLAIDAIAPIKENTICLVISLLLAIRLALVLAL